MSSLIQPIVDEVRAGRRSAVQVIEAALKRAEAHKDNNVFISLTRERALKRAAEIDESIQRGETVGPLTGVPFAVKDNFLTFGGDTTAASNILRGFEASYQATAVTRLEAAGAICIGKTNLDAFGHGSSTENSDFGPTKNPHDKNRVPGGSSGGSAAAVALGIVPFALGTDTGGSIRLPASFCGVVGLKPTYGLVSRWGVAAMASSTDVVGPLAMSAEDAGLVLDIMAGKDQFDSMMYPERDASYTPEVSNEPLKIGLIQEMMSEGLEPETRRQLEAKIEQLRAAGHRVEAVTLPMIKTALAIYYIVVPAEISSNLARYDGIKYGHTTKNAANLNEVYTKSRAEGFNAENKRRIMIGTYVLSHGYYDAYYRKAQLARTLLVNEFKKAFETYDVLIGPTSSGPAFKLGERASDPLAMYLVDLATVPVSLAGLPAVSVPAGTVNGLPVGLQIIGDRRSDRQVLTLARQLEELSRG